MPQCWLQAAFSCPVSEPSSTSRPSGQNNSLDFTASSAQTLSLKLLIKSLPSLVPLPSPSPCWPQPAHGTGLVCFFSQFSFTMSVYSFLSPVNLSCCLWPIRGVFPRVSPIFPVPPLPPSICICFRETSCCLEAALNSRGHRAKWRFRYSSSMSKWKEAA